MKEKETKGFKGEAKDFWTNDTTLADIYYDLNGLKDGPITMSGPSGKIMLEGHYSKNEKTGTWTVYGAETLTIDYSELGRPVKVVDSLETCLKRKETFQTSRFIRKKDYAEIYSLLPKPRSKLTKLRADGTSNFGKSIQPSPMARRDCHASLVCS